MSKPKNFEFVRPYERMRFTSVIKWVNEARTACYMAHSEMVAAGLGTFDLTSDYALIVKTFKQLGRIQKKLEKQLTLIQRDSPDYSHED